MGTISKPMRKYILSKDKAGYNKDKKRNYNNRIRDYSWQAIRDLAFIAKNLPEEQQEEIFNSKSLEPLIRELFTLKIDGDSHEEYKQNKNSEAIKKKRKRLLGIAGMTLRAVGETCFVRSLLPDQMSQLVVGFPYTKNFEYLIMTSMHEEI
jgi:hypothetical protein